MSSIIVSIKPEYVFLILSGQKRFEYRTVLCKKSIDEIIIYASAPISKVVGKVAVKGILSLLVEELWLQTGQFAGISKEKYDKYFAGRKIANAYVLGEAQKYNEYKTLSEFGIKRPPQNFIYL